MPALTARIGGTLVDSESPATFAAIGTPTQVDLRFDSAYANTAVVPLTLPASFAASLTDGGADVTQLPIGYLTDDDAPLFLRQTALLAVGSSPNVNLVIGDTSIALEVIPDTEAPSQVLNLTATVVGADIALAWDAATDDTAVTGYKVERATDSGFTANLTTLAEAEATTAFLDDTAAVTVPYFYRLSAFDAAGNYGTVSAAATATVPDTTAPTIAGTLTATPGDAQVTLDGPTATDNVAVVKWQYRVDAGAYVDIADSASGTMPETVVSPLPNGELAAFDVRAVDAAGNASSVASASATPAAANTAPSFLTGPSVGSITTTGCTISATYSDPEADTITATYRVVARGATPNWTGAPAFSSPQAVTGFDQNSPYDAYVRLDDGQGNVVVSAAVEFQTLISWLYTFDSGTTGVTKYDGVGTSTLSNPGGYVQLDTSSAVSNTSGMRLTGQSLASPDGTFHMRALNTDLAVAYLPWWLGNTVYSSHANIVSNFAATRVMWPTVFGAGHATNAGDWQFSYIDNAGTAQNLQADGTWGAAYSHADSVADEGHIECDVEFDAANSRWRVRVQTATTDITSDWVAYAATRAFTNLYLYAHESAATVAYKYRWDEIGYAGS